MLIDRMPGLAAVEVDDAHPDTAVARLVCCRAGHRRRTCATNSSTTGGYGSSSSWLRATRGPLEIDLPMPVSFAVQHGASNRVAIRTAAATAAGTPGTPSKPSERRVANAFGEHRVPVKGPGAKPVRDPCGSRVVLTRHGPGNRGPPGPVPGCDRAWPDGRCRVSRRPGPGAIPCCIRSR